ncbi:MAG: hypothetical protein J6Q39_08470 [Bacteroidales bacterium]|nr:hypothetical protein [Bacteroidales bacterium]
MKKIVFKKGDETRAKFENLRDENILNDSIFSDIYDSAFSLIAEISKQDNSEKSKQYDSEKSKQYDSEKSEHNRERNNIIAFIGERGSGKTSCLKSVYYSLDKQIGNPLPRRIKNIKVSFNNQLPIIDPSYLDERSNIIEIVIAHMFQSFKEAVNDSKYSYEGEKLEKKRELVKKFQEAKDALDCTNPQKSSYVNNDSIEELSKLASGSNLHNKMEELVKYYLDYFKTDKDDTPQMLVIAIDDLDVQTNHTYQMVEQIRKYLIIDNVLILMGVKLIQLSDLIKKKYLDDFNYKMDKSDLTDQIDDMVARYLIKLLPLSHRLNLPSYNEIPGIELDYIINKKAKKDIKNGNDHKKKENDSYASNNIQETILYLIYNKTGLMFYNTLEQESLIIPHNLRELLNLVALLNNMKDKDKNTNRNTFRKYFIESWCLDRLSSSQKLFINNMNECEVININKYIIDYIYTKYKTYFDNEKLLWNIDKSIVNSNNRSYNVSIADVKYILDCLSKRSDTSIKRFVYAIKTVYSIILYDKFEEMKSDEKLKYHSDLLYKSEANEIISYKSVNKLGHIFDYEIMLGGNMINIIPDVKTNKSELAKNDQKTNNNKELMYAGVIMAEKMSGIFEDWDNKLKDKEKYDEKEGECKDFNIFELFLLSTTYYGLHDKARMYKHCYYDSFPIDKYKGDYVSFNFTAIQYNIIRYYNLYRKYMYIKNNEEYDSDKKNRLMLVKFFDLIYKFKDNSIIYKLIVSQCEPTTEKKYYHSNYIEDSAILNIEVLELLEYYLGRIDELKNNDAIQKINSFIKKMKDFKYYTYTTNIKNDKKTIGYNEKHLSFISICDFFEDKESFKQKFDIIYNSYKNSQYEQSNPDDTDHISASESGESN